MAQVEKLSIFLASPSDVQRERALVREVIDEINRTVAPDKGVVLDLVSSERAIPGVGKDGQAIINEQIGDMEKHDLFVGIMWNRVGTPTPRDISGTAEEFARAVNALQRRKKPQIWFYFRQAAANLKTEEELEQKRGVVTFRAKLRGKGLFAEYTTTQSFAKKFREHLVTWLNGRSQKSALGPKKTGRRSPDTVSDTPTAGRPGQARRPAPGMDREDAPTPRKPTLKGTGKRGPLIVKNPSSWIMLDDHFFRTQSTNTGVDRSIVLRIAPTSPEQSAQLRTLNAGNLHRGHEVTYADQHEAGTTGVQSVTSETNRGVTVFTVTLAPLSQHQSSGALSEFSFNNYSADAIAELRARWLLLGQPLPKEIEHLAASHQGRGVYGVTNDRSIRTLPQLWAASGTQAQAFLPRAWLYAAYLLKTENIVEHILALELGPIKDKKMQVTFRGRRVQVYANREPVSIAIKDECRLEI
jgi:hypothetical protein